MFNKYMAEAIEEAKTAYNSQEVPVGAVVVYKNEIISRSHNIVIQKNNPLLHAEIIAIDDEIGRAHV